MLQSSFRSADARRCHSGTRLRGLASALAVAGLTMLGATSAWASPGCDAFQGQMSTGLIITGNQFATGFEKGDTITLTIINALNGDHAGIQNTTTFIPIIPLTDVTTSYTFPADSSDTYGAGYGASNQMIFTWSCVSASKSPGQKLSALQQTVTPIVGITSGQAITGAIDNAIGNAFSNGGAPFTGNSGGFAVNFAAEPQSKVAHDADKAFGALAYADGGMPTKAPRPLAFSREWSLWADVRGTGWRDNNANNDFNGRQLNITAGLSRKMTPDWLVGIVGGYETFNYDVASLTGTLKGDGGTIGAYTGWRISPTLRWDAALTWSRIGYDADVGTANGSFTGSRWIASTGLTGQYRWLSVVLEPSAKLFAVWENQGSWVDSTGASHTDFSFSVGRVSAGGRVIYPWTYGALSVSPYVGLYGDWRFGNDSVSSAAPFVGVENGWSGRVTGGLTIAQQSGGSVTLGGEYGGIGADYKLWTAQARVQWPF